MLSENNDLNDQGDQVISPSNSFYICVSQKL